MVRLCLIGKRFMTLYDFFNQERKSKGRKLKVGFFGIGSTAKEILSRMPREEILELTLRNEGLTPEIDVGFPLRTLTGKSAFTDIDEDIIFFAPSVRRDRDMLKPFFSSGANITSDCEIYFKDGYKDIYAISGSDGKSTTTYLVSEILTKSGIKATPSGNYGLPFCALTEDSGIAVAELSSFNLQYTEPKVYRALVTNITPNHLNWHESFEEYKQTKLKLLSGAAEAVISADDPILLAEGRKSSVFGVYSATLGLSELKKTVKAEIYVTLERGEARLNGESIFRIEDAKRREGYFLKNLLGAIALTAGKAKNHAIKEVAKSFGGLEHRAELVARKDEACFINSSIDTSPARTSETLKELKAPVRIILGGRDKGLSKARLLDAMAGKVTKIALYSEAKEEFERVIREDIRFSDIPLGKFERLADAIDFLLTDLEDGETVLLSPAATAYGEFQSFAERGRFFKEYIKGWLNI